MNALRSVIFNFFYIFGSFVISILLLWALVFPQNKCARIVGTLYGGYMLWISRVFMGLKLEFRGLANLPGDNRYIIGAKHQSAFETLTLPFMPRFNFPVIILKRELTWLPIWGLYPPRMGEVPIDRGSGMEAMNSITRGCKKAIDAGRPVAIFPQGTRVGVGVKAPYKSGIAKVYKDLNVPLVPMALNTGVFWGRNKFFKKSGTIVFEFLPPIPPGLPPLKMMEELEKTVEEATEKLVAEADAASL